MSSYMSELARGVMTTLWSQLKLKKPTYGKCIVEETTKEKITIIMNNKTIVIDGDNIEIIKGNSSITVDGELKVTGKNITFLINEGDVVEGMLSESKLKEYLLPRVGNFGAPLFADIVTADLTYNNIKVGKGS